MDHRQSVVVCELQVGADLAVVDALARLRLVVHQRGGRVRVWTGQDLRRLLELSGLDLVLQPGRQAEPWEEGVGVEEVVEVDEPTS